MTPNEKTIRLQDFISWSAQHLNGDEKGEAHIFLNRLFKGFSHAG